SSQKNKKEDTSTIQNPKELLIYIDYSCKAVFSFNQKSLTAVLGNTTARLKLKNNVGYSHSEHFSITLLVSRPKKLSMKKNILLGSAFHESI
ncbi:hypothetical protein, partial [Ornithobacterium rhinotracheale]